MEVVAMTRNPIVIVAAALVATLALTAGRNQTGTAGPTPERRHKPRPELHGCRPSHHSTTEVSLAEYALSVA